MSVTAQRGRGGTARAGGPAVRRPWYRDHAPFLVAVVLGAAVRGVVAAGFRPGLMSSDAHTYLSFLQDRAPHPDRPMGYGLALLSPVAAVSDSVAAVVTVQHVLGLVTAVVLYALLRRRGAGRWLSTLACAPVLLDPLQLLLEHTPLSDTFFVAMVSAGLAVLAWRPRPGPAACLAAVVLLGGAVTVRQVGLPLGAVAVGYCLLVGVRWRGRVGSAALVAAAFALPVGGYAAWYHSAHGVWELSDIGAKSAYMRTTTFVDCSLLELPPHERVLCPPEPRGERLDPTDYGWFQRGTVARLEPPPGTTQSEALADFAERAVRAQPGDYAATVLRDLALLADPVRTDRFDYSTASKWRFETYLDASPTAVDARAYAEHGGEQPSVHQPWADLVVGYEKVVYLPGPVVAVLLGLGLVGGLQGLRRPVGARRGGAAALLVTVSAVALALVPVATTEFVWRYQLPVVVMAPVGAVLGVMALADRRLRRGAAPTLGTAGRTGSTSGGT